MIGVGLTLCIFLSAATYHYKGRYDHLKMKARIKSEKRYRSKKHSRRDFGDQVNNKDPMQEMAEILQLLSGGGGDLYHEQYNEHRLRIERQVEQSY